MAKWTKAEEEEDEEDDEREIKTRRGLFGVMEEAIFVTQSHNEVQKQL